jgi:hypothetical protein
VPQVNGSGRTRALGVFDALCVLYLDHLV